jgi:hypothetical protein
MCIKRKIVRFYTLFIVISSVTIITLAQNSRFNEPDSDNDGIKDSWDLCPKIQGYIQYDGCPMFYGIAYIVSVPDSAKVYYYDIYKGITPLRINLVKDSNSTIRDSAVAVRISKEGYSDATILAIPHGPILADTYNIVLRSLAYSGDVNTVARSENFADIWDTSRTNQAPSYQQIPEGNPLEKSKENDYKENSSKQQNDTAISDSHKKRERRNKNSCITKGYLIDAPFTFALDMVGYQYKIPSNKGFRKFTQNLDYGFFQLNNFRSATLLNSLGFSFFNIQTNLKFGQWVPSINYKNDGSVDTVIYISGRQYRIISKTPGINGSYLYITDSTSLSIHSLSISAGISLPLRGLRFIYLIGYSWEDIWLEDAIVSYKNMPLEKKDIIFDNDHLFHSWRMELVWAISNISLGCYIDYSMTGKSYKKTGWYIFNTGFTMRLGDKNAF